MKKIPTIHDFAHTGDVAEIKKALKDKGVNINEKKQSWSGLAPIHIATLCHQKPVIELLVDKKADVNLKDENGFTPLLMCALDGDVELAKFFIKKGAKIDITNKRNKSVLHIAASKGHDKFFKEMKKLGADEKWQDDMGKTAEEVAKEFKKTNALKKAVAPKEQKETVEKNVAVKKKAIKEDKKESAAKPVKSAKTTKVAKKTKTEKTKAEKTSKKTKVKKKQKKQNTNNDLLL